MVNKGDTPGCCLVGAGADDERPGAGAVLRRPGPHQEHAVGADAGVHDRLDRSLVWVCWGYSLAFTGGSPFVGGFSKAFLKGVDASTLRGDLLNGVYIPEYVFVVFQMTFACITPALIVGAFAERIKFSAADAAVRRAVADDRLFPDRAHGLVLGRPGLPAQRRRLRPALGQWARSTSPAAPWSTSTPASPGLVGCLMIGKRIGYGTEPMPPHSLTMTMIGASLLWVGWFGFNAGSNLEANGVTALAFINTFVATAAAALAWALVEQIVHRASRRCSARDRRGRRAWWRSPRPRASPRR
jgi:Amt family ammonium transporter